MPKIGETASPISFKGLSPASAKSSAAARAASRKIDTRCELILRHELWRRGFRYRLHKKGLPGCPDIVFSRHKVVIFCDGDFWHGRNIEARLAKLERGHNASYWVNKVQRNIQRDLRHTHDLEAAGWRVLRFWETDLLRDVSNIADHVAAILAERSADHKRR